MFGKKGRTYYDEQKAKDVGQGGKILEEKSVIGFVLIYFHNIGLSVIFYQLR